MNENDKTSSLQVSIASSVQLGAWIEYAEQMLDIRPAPDNMYFYIEQMRKISENLTLRDIYTAVDLAAYGRLNLETKEIRSLAPMRINKLFSAYRAYTGGTKNNHIPNIQGDNYTEKERAEIHQKFLETLKNGFQKYRETNEMPVMTPIYVYQFYVKQGLIQPDEELKNEINTQQENRGNSIGAIMRRSLMQGYEYQKIKELYDELINEGKELELYEIAM